jgi:hypothetical protein
MRAILMEMARFVLLVATLSTRLAQVAFKRQAGQSPAGRRVANNGTRASKVPIVQSPERGFPRWRLSIHFLQIVSSVGWPTRRSNA